MGDDGADPGSQRGRMPQPELYTYEQAAVVLGVKPDWLRRAVAMGQVPHRRLRRLVRFARSDLDAIIASALKPAVAAQASNRWITKHRRSPRAR